MTKISNPSSFFFQTVGILLSYVVYWWPCHIVLPSLKRKERKLYFLIIRGKKKGEENFQKNTPQKVNNGIPNGFFFFKGLLMHTWSYVIVFDRENESLLVSG